MDEQPAARRIPDPLDLRRTEKSLGSELNGYGLTPSGARERAGVVRAVTQDQGIRQRPMPVVIATAVIALVAVVVWAWQLYGALTDKTPLTLLFWAGLVTFLVAAAICSWAWQLYDVKKAIVMWVAIAVLGIAAALVIVVVLVALKGDGDADLDLDLDGLLGKITGSSARHGGDFVGQVVAPLALDTIDTVGYAGAPIFSGSDDPAPPPARDPADDRPGPRCPTCGRPITAGLLICPRCGSSLA